MYIRKVDPLKRQYKTNQKAISLLNAEDNSAASWCSNEGCWRVKALLGISCVRTNWRKLNFHLRKDTLRWIKFFLLLLSLPADSLRGWETDHRFINRSHKAHYGFCPLLLQFTQSRQPVPGETRLILDEVKGPGVSSDSTRARDHPGQRRNQGWKIVLETDRARYAFLTDTVVDIIHWETNSSSLCCRQNKCPRGVLPSCATHFKFHFFPQRRWPRLFEGGTIAGSDLSPCILRVNQCMILVLFSVPHFRKPEDIFSWLRITTSTRKQKCITCAKCKNPKRTVNLVAILFRIQCCFGLDLKLRFSWQGHQNLHCCVLITTPERLQRTYSWIITGINRSGYTQVDPPLGT